MKRFVLPIAIALLCLSHADFADARKSHHDKEREQTATQSKDFDYYLLSLSWSPSFCATHPQERDQCGGQGYGFVLHGLWPEYTAGGGPQHCSATSKPDEATVQSMLKVSPSRGLIAHEWQTHGACSGLDPAEYFAGAQKAFRSIRIPPAIATATTPPSSSRRTATASGSSTSTTASTATTPASAATGTWGPAAITP